MLENEQPDIVDICVPTFLHTKYAIDMLNRGYIVQSEKPMALTYEDCLKMVEAADNRLTIGQCLRFSPEYQYLRDVVASGEFGKPVSAELRRLSGPPTWGWDNWFMDYERSGGCLFDMHIHDLDIARVIFGEPKKVSCHTADVFVKDSIVQSTLIYDDLSVLIIGDWSCKKLPFEVGYKVTFEKANIIYAGGSVTVYPFDGDKFAAPIEYSDMYANELEYLVDFTTNKTENTLNKPECVAKTIKLAEALRESAQKHGEVIPFNA